MLSVLFASCTAARQIVDSNAAQELNPAEVSEILTMTRLHFLLHVILDFPDSFEAAVKLFQPPTNRRVSVRMANDVVGLLTQSVVVSFQPQVGVMVIQVAYIKARSVNRCSQPAASGGISVRCKYDREYCQVHIDLSKDTDPIKILFKSGRNPTDNSMGLHSALR